MEKIGSGVGCMKLQDMSVKERKVRFILVIIFSLFLIGTPLWALLFPSGAIFTFFLHLFFNDRTWTFGVLIFFVIAFTGMGLHFCTLKWKALVADKARETAFTRAPERRVPATVISKMTHLNEYHEMVYHVAFALPSGERKNFTPLPALYNTVSEGETGMLTYKEHGEYLFFVHFKSQH